MGHSSGPGLDSIRKAVLTVAALNFAYFLVELVMAVRLGSVSLFADSVDFFEDTAINMLVFFALTWSLVARKRAGMVLAAVILLPAIAALVTAVMKMLNPVAPEPGALTLTAVGALVVNVVCAVILLRLRAAHGEHGEAAQGQSLTRGAWLAARNDALANVLIIAAGLATFVVATGWIDIVVGLIIAALNFTAAKEVWETAQSEEDPLEMLDDD